MVGVTGDVRCKLLKCGRMIQGCGRGVVMYDRVGVLCEQAVRFLVQMVGGMVWVCDVGGHGMIWPLLTRIVE